MGRDEACKKLDVKDWTVGPVGVKISDCVHMKCLLYNVMEWLLFVIRACLTNRDRLQDTDTMLSCESHGQVPLL